MQRRATAVRLPRTLGGAALALLILTVPLPAESPISLGVLLTTVPEVSATARSALINEATRIWARAGVRLAWLPAGETPPPDIDTLRILAVHRPPPNAADAFVLGELVRVGEAHPVALVSLRDARAISQRLQFAPTPVAVERRLGLILGRAAAHEIGHYLLRTSTHARRGLMRAVITDREFADPRGFGFDLDVDARAWLQARSDDLPASTTLLPASVRESAFNYIP